MAEGVETALESQRKDLANLIKLSLKKGDAWFLLDMRWFKQWKKYVGFDSWDTVSVGDPTYFPGPIDNSPLLKETPANSSSSGQQLKEHLVDELDYVLLPAEGWNKMVAYYGIKEGQEPIERHVIEQGMFVKHCKVEVYLMDLKLTENSDINTVISKQFSRAATIDQLEQVMRQVFNIEEKKEVRLWNRYMSNTYEHLSKKDHSLQDAGLYQGQVIVVEQKNEDGTWPRQAKSTSAFNSNNTYSSGSGYNSYNSGYGGTSSSSSGGGGSGYYNYDKPEGCKPGLCGLANLGNTCFMNSALQCMSNVPGLTSYMLSGRWEQELNKENPLGMRGEIAISFAELVREMWSGARAYTVPRNFKIAVGRFAPQFSGYQQQDAQELMAFLLDGLHEDLNRIRKKPYIELKDALGREDSVVAKEAWENYKKRNDSIIVDTFHGLLKSTVQCPDCQKISVTFDPFCYLSLPLPMKKDRQMEVFWVSASPDHKPVQLKVTVPKGGCVLDLCKALSNYVKVPADRMVVTDVYNHRFHKVFGMEEGLNHILDRDDIFIYEVPVAPVGEVDYLQIPVYFRQLGRKSSQFTTSSNQLFGQPIILAVPPKCTYQVFYHRLLHRLSRFVQAPKPGEVWWKEEEEGVPDEGSSTDQSWHSATAQRGEEGQSSSDIKMETERAGGDGETKGEQEASTSTSTPVQQSHKNSSGEGASVKTQVKDEETREPSRPIFHLTYVNSYGSSDNMAQLHDDGRPIKLTSHTYISADWTQKARSLFYDEKNAEDLEQHDTMRNRNTPKRPVMQLHDCLRLFTEAEQLSEQDPWYCPQCRKHQQATKKFDLWSLPNYLIIHLKRFSYNRYWRDKIDSLVDFPTRGLDMREYILNRENRDENVYDLIAVTNHYGGLGGGHYTAFAQNKEDGDWYYFDDSSVSSSSEDSVVTKAAYVLVYKRRGADCAAASQTIASQAEHYPNSLTSSSDDDMDTN